MNKLLKSEILSKKINSGFSLIELVVSIAILLIIVTISFGTISRYFAIRTFYEQQTILQQNFVYAMDRLSDDIMQSSVINGTAFVNPPQNNAIIDATLTSSENPDDSSVKNKILTFYGSDGITISYYLKENTNGTYAIYRKRGADIQPVTEEMHQLVRLYFIRYGSEIVAIIVGEVTYFGHTNKISFTSVIYSRNSPQAGGS